eukprot:2778617-Alexandrium_andersonii.AAC.1
MPGMLLRPGARETSPPACRARPRSAGLPADAPSTSARASAVRATRARSAGWASSAPSISSCGAL